MKWTSLEDEKPQHGEVVLAANTKSIAVCAFFIHSEDCPPDCQYNIGDMSFYSCEVEGRTLNGITHFMRIRNPHEVLQ